MGDSATTVIPQPLTTQDQLLKWLQTDLEEKEESVQKVKWAIAFVKDNPEFAEQYREFGDELPGNWQLELEN